MNSVLVATAIWVTFCVAALGILARHGSEYLAAEKSMEEVVEVPR